MRIAKSNSCIYTNYSNSRKGYTTGVAGVSTLDRTPVAYIRSDKLFDLNVCIVCGTGVLLKRRNFAPEFDIRRAL